ncbi:MAG: aminoglycoside phosphotransferase family protein [Microcoleus sp. CSU_2_2]|nr:aminoglycoside phosphotransferase family protein [Microcoleus sp. CSU_2_2]
MSSKELDRSALTARAVAASVSVASTYGVRAIDPHVLADAYSVRVHLKPAPIVARISTLTPILRSPIESWLARELSVAEFLAAKGAPVVPPSDLLPSKPHHCDGLAMTFWRYFEPVSDALPAAAIVGQMQAELHPVLRDYPGDLPLLGPPLNDIPRGIDRLKQLGNILPASDLTLLQTTYDRLLPQLSNPVGLLQPLHGDAHALNLIPTAKGLLWNDFEDTCTGSIAWDCINLDDEGIAAYPNAPDLATLEPYRQMRKLHAIVWVYAMLPELPDWLESAKALLVDLRVPG